MFAGREKFTSVFIYFLVACNLGFSSPKLTDTSSKVDSAKTMTLLQQAKQMALIDFHEAKNILHKGKFIAKKNGFTYGTIEIYNELGGVCRKSGEYDSAIFYHLKCLKLREQIKDYKGVGKSTGNIGIVYIYLKDTLSAKKYLEEAKKISQNYNDSLLEGKLFNIIGNLEQENNHPDLALHNYNMALKIFESLNDTVNMAISLQNIGASYFFKESYLKALDSYQKVKRIHIFQNNETALVTDLDNIASTFKFVNIDSSFYYLKKALNLAFKTKAELARLSIYNNMAALYEKTLNFEEAFYYNELFIRLNDSIYTKEKNEAIAELQTKYETEKKQKEIEGLLASRKIQSLLSNSLIIVVVLVLIIVFVIYNRYRYGQKSYKILNDVNKRSEELLLNILPKETAEELKQSGKTTAKHFENVSVLFTDMKGFTNISAKMTPTELVKELDRYFGKFDEICEKYGLEKIKTIGDAYMAAAGLNHEKHIAIDQVSKTVTDCIMAGMEMQSFVLRRYGELKEKGLLAFEMRLGINTGPVVAGVVGQSKFQYDIWGDTVNTASRMESNGEVRKVNISKSTYEHVKSNENLKFEHRGLINVKGKGQIEMWFVERV